MFSLVWQGLGHAGEGLIQGIGVRLKSGRQELGLYQYSGRPWEEFKQRHDSDS